MDRNVTASKTKFPPQRGLVMIRVVKSLSKSVTAFASLAAAGLKRGNGNGQQDGTTSPSTTPPIPSGYTSDA
ncbi:hypothetical protein CR513_49819, partial [Mucuna pruriens]